MARRTSNPSAVAVDVAGVAVAVTIEVGLVADPVPCETRKMTPTEKFMRFGEAFESRNRAAFDAATSVDISMTPVPGWPDQGPFVGRDAAWEFMLGTEDAFDEVLYDGATESEERDNVVYTCVKRRMRPKGMPEHIEVLLYMVATVAEEGVADVRSFLDRGQARETAGLGR